MQMLLFYQYVFEVYVFVFVFVFFPQCQNEMEHGECGCAASIL